MAEKKMPADIEAEQSLLGCCMASQEIATEIVPQLAVGDMFRKLHQRVLGAMKVLIAKGRPCDPITVRHYMDAHGGVEASDIAKLVGCTYGIEGAWRSHLEIVKLCARQRQMIRVCRECEAVAWDPQEDAESFRTAILEKLAGVVLPE